MIVLCRKWCEAPLRLCERSVYVFFSGKSIEVYSPMFAYFLPPFFCFEARLKYWKVSQIGVLKISSIIVFY